jgi:hypothetical protein
VVAARAVDLSVAHPTGREAFGWEDIVDAITIVESGTAVDIEYVPEETRAVAVHQAGHALAAHAYLKGAESTRPFDPSSRWLPRVLVLDVANQVSN